MTEFAVAPLGKLPRLFLIAAAGLLPLGIVIAAVAATPSRTPLLWLALALPLVLTLGLVLAMQRRAIAIDDGHLVVKATVYTLRLPIADIDLGAARTLDLGEQRELRPWLKTNGFAVPGFQAGHFRSRDRRKLFCLVTAPRVLALPLRDGRTVLLSAERPQALLEALRRAATAPPDRRHSPA